MQNSKQRRHLPDLQRPQKHRAVDEAQRKGARAFCLPARFLAERVDAGATPDIGVLFYNSAEARIARSSAPSRLVTSWLLTPGADAVERRLRHALFQHLPRCPAPNHLLDSGHRHLQFAVEAAAGAEARVPAATAISSPCAIRDCTIFDPAAGAWISRNRSGQGLAKNL